MFFYFKSRSQDICRLRVTCDLKTIFGPNFTFSFPDEKMGSCAALKQGIVYTSAFLSVFFQRFQAYVQPMFKPVRILSVGFVEIHEREKKTTCLQKSKEKR